MCGLSFVWILTHFPGHICVLFTCPSRSFLVEFFSRNHRYDLLFWRLASELSHHARGILNRYAPLFQPAVQFSQEICSRTYSIVLTRCLWPLFLKFAIFMKLSLMTVFTVLRLGKDRRYGFDIFRKHWRLAFVFSLLVRLIWFHETAKLSTFVLSNFKRMTW